ncbi:hypothetical protein LA345_12915 [Burkholderia vietnamiensis]|uniref:Uncharacterized protein n=1 Tax=Burkholderia vietnamiensis (strain G4 / LMG 22486) TaxID=269482 RepID=A4JFK0_BURVG|nr:hypothetical protein Bcep1808_2051 [Burkholderia vietnamiensis G4]MCB4344813.1 hypothetical protein [Burkholderia vietnamiensis]
MPSSTQPTPTPSTLVDRPPVPSRLAIVVMRAISQALKPHGEVDRAVAFDETGRQRALVDFTDELLANEEGCRSHHLYLDTIDFTLHVLPGVVSEGGAQLVRLPLHGDTVGLGMNGREALVEWIETLAQILTVPELCARPVHYHPFIRALNAL